MLKAQNADKATEGLELSEQIQAVRAEINARDVEIRDLSTTIHSTISSNQVLEKDIETLKFALNDQQEVRSRQQGAICQLNAAVSKGEQECFALHSRIQVLEKERNVLVDKTGVLNETLHVRSQNCDECQSRIHAA